MFIVHTRYGAFGGTRPEWVTRLVFGQSTTLDGTTVKSLDGTVIDHVEIIEQSGDMA